MLSLLYGLLMVIDFSPVLGLSNTYTISPNHTHWQSSSNFVPSQNTSYGSLILKRAVEIEFNFEYYGKESANNTYENVFRIGYSGPNTCTGSGTRYPAMWMHPNHEKNEFQITISNGKSSTSCWNNPSPWVQINKYTKYHIFIAFNQSWKYASIIHNNGAKEVFINEERKAPTANSILETLGTVWFSTEHVPSANCCVSNISIRTWNPLTFEPTNAPSNNPSLSPTFEPSTESIHVFQPTNAPLYERHITETVLLSTVIEDKTTNDGQSSWISAMTRNSYVWLIIPIFIGFLCVMCCFVALIYIHMRRSKSKGANNIGNNENENEIGNEKSEEDSELLFGKIYDKQIQLNIEDQHNNDNILLPNEESVSSDTAEQMYIPQTRPSNFTAITTLTAAAPIVMNISQHIQYGEQDCDSNSSDEDIDILIKKKKSQKLGVSQLVMSESATPDMELYGKGKTYSNDDVKSNDSLYTKPNHSDLQTPTNVTQNESIASALYVKSALYENSEGSHAYESIQQLLQICEPTEWEKYLNNFKTNKVSDFRLDHDQLNSHDWRELIPKIGPRNEFQRLWFQFEQQRTKSMHL